MNIKWTPDTRSHRRKELLMTAKNSEFQAIIAKKLTRIYDTGERRVIGLDGIDLTVAPGEMILLKGVSGSGKSTLLSLLAGLDRPTSGHLTVAGHDLENAAPDALTRFRRRAVGMVFQSFNLLPTLTVMENVCLPALLAGGKDADIREKAWRLLEQMNLAGRLDHLPAQLSGGEMQRTAIARALINDPAIILADEPTGNLDSANGDIVIQMLAELNRKDGRTVIIATHSDQADAFANRRLLLRDGALSCD